MTEYINPVLPNKKIVVTRDCDRTISIRRRDELGVETNWDASVYILIDIDRTTPTRIDGVVAGSLASIRMESTVLNSVRNGTTWRVVMSQASTPTYETAVMVGSFERNDGR
jgi:hypothetical protein